MPRCSSFSTALSLVVIGFLDGASLLWATDYYLTLGGGYAPHGNQASLEANVLFLEQVLVEHGVAKQWHTILFADGDDPEPDLQYSVPENGATGPATQVLQRIFRPRSRSQGAVAYRNHHIDPVAGKLHPRAVREQLAALREAIREGDRLVIYVTAHGSRGSREQPLNTTIDCWSDRRIEAQELERWLRDLPSTCSVVMVMAQCYCGGFAYTMFRDLEPANGLAQPLRVGFFAQRYDRPAAGCRPDIGNDQEFSSFFWGAMVGRTRNGTVLPHADLNDDGRVSFAEAYAIAVVHADTIDVPLRTSDVFLRSFSFIPGYFVDWERTWRPDAMAEDVAGSSNEQDTNNEDRGRCHVGENREPFNMSGPLSALLQHTSTVNAQAIEGLCQRLGIDSQHATIESILEAEANLRDRFEQQRAAAMRRGRGRSAWRIRRTLRQEILDRWPELADADTWPENPLLSEADQPKLLSEIENLPSWEEFHDLELRRDREREERVSSELQLVKFERLRFLIESVVLERNFLQTAQGEQMDWFQRIVALENSTL
ncbi:MAG: hypothetical protein KatS3mg111_4131 [Pirellulaceae bacterium]|nr:MAG: hypothetical protein KatS3mg111_4131 [Pirellulaceae bacterium]